MPMPLDEFRASLLRADLRSALGIHLADDEAQRVHDDPVASQNWYDYWLALQPVPPVAAPPPYGVPGAQETQPYPFGTLAGPAPGAPAQKRNVGLWVSLSILGALILIAVIVVAAAFATARHWTKVDVPEQPETFHTEEYETGRYDVTMDEVNPCWVDQDWTDCTNLMVATYNGACVDVELTENAQALCDEYIAAIDEMKAQDGDGYTVASLGTFGNLHRTAETATREVSNDDGRPAVTHEAVCYLGFIGECR